MHTLFVTGAGGFAGSRLVEYLRRHGYDVVAGVRNRARKLAYERQNGKALVCDVADPINVARAIASVRPEGVIHLAGISQPADAAGDPLAAYQTIVTSWANVLDAVRRAVPRAKVVLASACDVYGNEGSDGRPLGETAALRPVSTFGSLKAAAESIAHTFYRDYHLNVTIARPFHYTGPGQSKRFFFAAVAHMLAGWDSASQGSEIRLPDLSCRRDLLHVDDVVVAYERLLLDGRPNEVYNICSGTAYPCRELVEALVRDTGHSIRVADTPPDAAGVPIPALCGDNTKIRTELSWTPTRTAQEAIAELLASCKPSLAAAAR